MQKRNKKNLYILVIGILVLCLGIFLTNSNQTNLSTDVFDQLSSEKSIRYTLTNDGSKNYVITDDKAKFLGINNLEIINYPTISCTGNSKIDNEISSIYIEEDNSLALFWKEETDKEKIICASKYIINESTWTSPVTVSKSDKILGDFKISKFEENNLVIIYRKKFCSHVSLVGKTLRTKDLKPIPSYNTLATDDNKNHLYGCKRFYSVGYEFPIADFLSNKYGEIADYEIEQNTMVFQYLHSFTKKSSFWLANLNPSKDKTPRTIRKYNILADKNTPSFKPKLGISKGGTRMLVWESEELGDGKGFDVYGMIFDKYLNKLKNESFFRVNLKKGDDQKDVGILWEDDNFLIYYKSELPSHIPGNKSNIISRKFFLKDFDIKGNESLIYSHKFAVINNITPILDENGGYDFLIDTQNDIILVK